MSSETTDNFPPFYKALKKFAKKKATLWSTPGHNSGNGLKACPAGKDFYEFFGHNLFLADISSSVEELGSILEHQGPPRPKNAPPKCSAPIPRFLCSTALPPPIKLFSSLALRLMIWYWWAVIAINRSYTQLL